MKNTKPVYVYPSFVNVGGIPYLVAGLPYTGEELRTVSNHDYADQVINVQEGLPYPRWLQYLVCETAILILQAAGVSPSTCRNVASHVGPVLYRVLRENKFDWLHADDIREPPTTVFVNGMPYSVTTAEDAFLEARECIGYVEYATLTIRLHSKLQAEAKAVTFLHELGHAILYEARLQNLCNKESLVEPLSRILYQFFKDNDFNFAYNG